MTEPKLNVLVLGTGAANMRALGGVGPAKIVDPVSAAPVVQGPHGRAWLCDLANGRKRMNIRAADDGTVAHWVIEAPRAHPVWHSYSLVLVHLRPMADGRKTMFYLPDATHEFWLHALDPAKDRNHLIATGIVRGNWLTPKNFAAQIREADDDAAQLRIREAVQAICDGRLSPDTDFTQQWVLRFGNNMMKDRPGRAPPTVSDAKPN